VPLGSALYEAERRLSALPLRLLLKLSRYRDRRRSIDRAGFTPLKWTPGLSVIIPERGGGDLLADCLDGLQRALRAIDEPSEIIVVVNGSPRHEYASLEREHPQVRWQFHPRALGFSRAVLEGVREAGLGGIYLLNNDMRLEPDALAEVLRWRHPAVFSIASQILFPDDGRRREETGWTFMEFHSDAFQPSHAESTLPDVRGTVWAGAGSSLYHAAALREMLPGCLPYDPFYWEDVDLGMRAHRRGWESLYCPHSRALHLHRVTVRRYNRESEVERIFERNRMQLGLRAPPATEVFEAQLGRLNDLSPPSLRELGRWSNLVELWRAHRHAATAPIPEPDLRWIPRRRYLRPTASPILIVSPFALLPPRHGGALRSIRLAAELARENRVILLSDEADLYPEVAGPGFEVFDAIYLCLGRAELGLSSATDRVARMTAHAHERLRSELRRLIDLHRPSAVLIEHMELAPLIETREQCRWQPPFWLSLQDVLLQPDEPSQADADHTELALIDRYQQLIVCSPEDQALLAGRDSELVPNGCDPVPREKYRPSCGRNILFVGPFRAEINWVGIREFVHRVYPKLRAQLADVSLTIVGGPGARERAASAGDFEQPGIEIVETVERVEPLLQRAALTINPQPVLRGSSLKVLESLANGRICVSTSAGSRGHLQHAFAGLIACERIADFESPLVALLGDPARRHALESADLERIAEHSWSACAAPLQRMARTLDAETTLSRERENGDSTENDADR